MKLLIEIAIPEKIQYNYIFVQYIYINELYFEIN